METLAYIVAHKSTSNKIRKTRRAEEKKPAKEGRRGGGGRKGDRKRNRGMNLFMDGARSSGDGRAGGGINAKLAIHTKSAWVQVKRGEYISPGINLFELGLHWNNWTLQRAMISECSCGRGERVRERERRGRRWQMYRPSGSVEDPRGAERRQGGTVKLKKAGGGERTRKRRNAERKGKRLETTSARRGRVSRDVQVQFARNLCNGMRQTSSKIHGFIPAHATPLTMERIHCFYSASCMRIYEARLAPADLLALARVPSGIPESFLLLQGSSCVSPRNDATARMAICAYRGYYLRDAGHEVNERGVQGSLGN